MATQQLPTVGSKVLVSGGITVGTVKTLVADERGNEIAGIAVESGFLRRHIRLVSLDAVKWVNPDSVVLRLTRKAFDAIPEPAQTPASAGATRHGTVTR